MKQPLLLLIGLLFAMQLLAQSNAPCTAALPSYQFQQRLREVKNASSETVRLEIVNKFLETYCITSEQAKQIAEAFANDFDRLDFAKKAYLRTIDQDNFYDVYDAFGYFSNVFRLHDYIEAHKNPTTAINTTVNDMGGIGSNPSVTFPNYQYPDIQVYQGKRLCQNPVNETAFINYYQQIKAQPLNQQQSDMAISLAQQQCFTTAQFMKLSSIFGQEEAKLDLLKRGMAQVYDIDNYYFAEQVFQDFRKRMEFKQFYEQNRNTTNPSTGVGNIGSYPCTIDAPTLSNLRQQIDQERFNNKRLAVARQLVQDKGACFTSEQMKVLVGLFNFETSRLEMAKFGYEFVVDKEVYINTVSEAFTFATSKSSLEKHVNGG